MPRVTIGPFSLEAAPDWTLSSVILAGPRPRPDEAPALSRAKMPQSFQQNLIATMEAVPPGETADAYLARQVAGLQSAGISRSEAVPPQRVILGDGLEGVLLEQVIEGPDGQWVQQMQLITIKAGVAYTLIASHLAGEPFRQARSHLKQMLMSFR